MAGGGAAGTVTAGGTAGGSAGAGGSNAQAGAGGSASAGENATGGTTSPGGGAGGGGGMGASSGGNGGATGGRPSTDGLPFVGSCLVATHCTDEWDTTFGAAALEALCTSQEGTWSTGHCATGNWKKKCTQAVFGGVYVQFLPADGVCALGFEEPL